MRSTWTAIFLAVIFLSCMGFAQCEPSIAVRRILDQAQPSHFLGLSKVEEDARRIAILEKGLAKYPDDYFLLSTRMAIEPDQEAQIRWANSLQAAHVGRPVYELLYAGALFSRNTPEAISMLHRLEQSRPEAARAYLELATIHSYGKFKDEKALQADVSAFLQQCPASLDSSALEVISLNGMKDQMLQTASAVRKRLANHTGPYLENTWKAVWKMEFKARLGSEQPLLQKQISHDLAEFQRSSHLGTLEFLLLLHTGYELTHNEDGLERTEEQILTGYDAARQSLQIAEQRWNRKHPTLVSEDQKKKAAYYKASLADAIAWQKRWPNNSVILAKKLEALTNLDDTTPEEIASAGDELLKALAAHDKNPENYYAPSFYFQVARTYVDQKIRLDQVPMIAEKSYRANMKREEAYAKDDYLTETAPVQMNHRVVYFKLLHMGLMIDYYEVVKNPAKAREIDEELKHLDVSAAEQPYVLRLRAQAAGIEGHPLDELFFYRAARDAAVATSEAPRAALYQEKLEAVWKELGGTPEAYSFFLDEKKTAPAVAGLWVPPKNPLPQLPISDLQGKTWELSHWNGKTLLINVWATWCPPCREELPRVQRLYSSFKDRKDVELITLNVDEDVSQVGPFLQQNQYTFPVFLAKKFVDAVDDNGVPQTWIVNKGKLVSVMISGSYKWEEVVQTKLQDLQKEQN